MWKQCGYKRINYIPTTGVMWKECGYKIITGAMWKKCGFKRMNFIPAPGAMWKQCGYERMNYIPTAVILPGLDKEQL